MDRVTSLPTHTNPRKSINVLRPCYQKKAGLGFKLGRSRFQSRAFTSSLLLYPRFKLIFSHCHQPPKN